MTDADFWEAERELWLGGTEAFRRWVPAEGLMAFADPLGILAGRAIFENVAPGPRWEKVDFVDPQLRRTGSHATVLGYRMHALRPGGAPYRAICTSTYVQEAGAWWLVQHQQTPSGTI